MKQFLITVAGVLVGLTLFLIVAPIVLISTLAGPKAPAPSAIVLDLDLRRDIPDQRPQSVFLTGRLSTVEIVRKLEAAANDSKVKGVYVRANTTGVPPSQAEEIRTALAKVKAANKFIIAHIQDDSARMSLGGYMTVAGANEVWLQDTGELQPMGMVSEETFLGGTLEKFHITAQFEQREEYKNAVNDITQKGYTPAHREASQGLVDSIYQSAVAAIAADRNMTLQQADAAVKGTPYTGQGAIQAKLVDKLGRPEDAQQAALAKAGDGAKFVEISDYTPPARSGPVIALVDGEGDIVSGPPSPSPFSDQTVMNSDEVAKALKEASEDSNVKAIIFRVNSPGGSAVASDQILHAVELAKAKGKKVVVSMGPYAASGGYYVSAAADAIVASPTTITGSIGIFGGKLVLADALNRYFGVTTGSVEAGSPYVNMYSSAEPFSNSERVVFKDYIDRGYAEFLRVVADGRHMSAEKARAVAKGRVWTGVQAKENGLVDELGGLSVAVARAKKLAGIADKTYVALKLYPRRKTPFQELQDLFGVSSDTAHAAAMLGALLGDERVERALRAALAADRTAALNARAAAMDVR